MSSWATVWRIAAMRHSSKQGADHLSKHAFLVLQNFVETDAKDAMANALGSVQWTR